MPLFDTYLIVDWSSSSSPGVGRDTVWLGLVEHGASRSRALNPPTRIQGTSEIVRVLRDQKARPPVQVSAVCLGRLFGAG